MHASKLGRTAAALSLPALSLCCATAIAQSKYQPSPPPKPNQARPAPTPKRLPSVYDWTVANQLATTQTKTVTFETRGQKVSITLRTGSNVTAKVDGAAVPSKQIHRSGQYVAVTDGDGEVLATITTSSPWSAKNPYSNWTRGQRAAMGLSVVAVPPAVAVHIDVDPRSAVLVKRITKGKAADRAKLRVHDVIVSLNGQTPVTAKILSKFLASKKPKDRVRVEYLRGGQKHSTIVELDGQSYYFPGNNQLLPPFKATPAPAPDFPKANWHSAFQRDNNQVVFTPPSPYTPRFNLALPKYSPNVARSGYVKANDKDLPIRAEIGKIQRQIQKLLDRLDKHQNKVRKAKSPNIEKPANTKKRDY